MRHSDIRLTMGVYTDPKLLDVRGTLDALPTLLLTEGPAGDRETVRVTGRDGTATRTVAPTVAPTTDNRGKSLSLSGNPFSGEDANTVAASGSPVKTKEPLTTGVNGSLCRGERIRTSDLLNPIRKRCILSVTTPHHKSSIESNLHPGQSGGKKRNVAPFCPF